MTLREAKEVLAKPVFGDPRCLEAKKHIDDHEEAERLRKALTGKHVECWCCEGDGELHCHAACVHVCPTCEGEEDLTLTQSILADLVLYQLRDLAKELAI